MSTSWSRLLLVDWKYTVLAIPVSATCKRLAIFVVYAPESDSFIFSGKVICKFLGVSNMLWKCLFA